MRAGIQISSLKQFLFTPEAVSNTVRRLSEIGCEYVQSQWIAPDVNVEHVAKAYSENGITNLGTQEKFDACVRDFDYFLRLNRACLSSDICFSGIPERYMSADGICVFIREFTSIVKTAACYGMSCSYHPIKADFRKINGNFAADTILGELSDIKIVPDTCQLLRAGIDAPKWINSYAGRIDIIHFKDTLGLSDNSPLAPVGEGVTDFSKILPACANAGIKYILAEQETFSRDPFECMRVSFQNINSMLAPFA